MRPSIARIAPIGSPGDLGRRGMARFCVSRATLTRHSCRETRHPGASDASVSGVTLHKTNPSDPTRTSMRHRSDAKRTHATAARKPSTPRHEIRNEPEPAKRRGQTGRWLGTGPRRSAARSGQASAREGRPGTERTRETSWGQWLAVQTAHGASWITSGVSRYQDRRGRVTSQRVHRQTRPVVARRCLLPRRA
jgi:hypothetical protein